MKNVYLLLELLVNKKAINEINAMTQYEIQNQFTSYKGEKLCDKSVYLMLKRAYKSGYIAEGLLHGNAKTYYISQTGLGFMKDAEFSEIDEPTEITSTKDVSTEKLPMVFDTFIEDMNYSKQHFESIETLLKYKNVEKIEKNREVLIGSINLIINTLQELKDNL